VHSTKGHQFYKNHHFGGFLGRSKGSIRVLGRSLLADLMGKRRSAQHFYEEKKGMMSSS
jgi:hypothetical protein